MFVTQAHIGKNISVAGVSRIILPRPTHIVTIDSTVSWVVLTSLLVVVLCQGR